MLYLHYFVTDMLVSIRQILKKINSLLNNAFRESGKGVGISYNQKGFYVRIDHLFHSKDWRSFDTRIDSHIQASDHYPLVSFIQKNTK